MKRTLIALLLFLSISSASAAADAAKYRQRCDTLISFFAQHSGGKDFFTAIAKLKTGTDTGRALRYLDTLLQRPVGGSYWMFSTIALYLHGHKTLPQKYITMLRELWRVYVPVCGTSEHERLLYYSSLYLATQNLPDAETIDWFNGKSTDENRADARHYIEQWCARVARDGMEEFDSPSRGGFFLAALALVYDFAKDDSMKRRAEVMLWWLLSDYAEEYLNGMYCGAHSREAEFVAIAPRLSTMSAFGSLLFGDIPAVYANEALVLALSTFQPPAILHRIATDRREAYIAREIKQAMPAMRASETRRRDVYKYTYMTPSYAIGSIDGGLVQPFEQHSWDVTWKSTIPNSTIFSTQPAAQDTILSRFFPADENTNLTAAAREYTRYVTFNKNTDGSPFERFFQHKNTLIALYDIPPIKTFPLYTAFFPKALDEWIVDSLKSRWVFCKSGDVFIAVLPFTGYFILNEEAGHRLVSPNQRNGLICQVASKKEAGTFQKFVKKIKASRVDLTRLQTDTSVSYKTIFGDELRFAYDGDRVLNGNVVQFDTSKLFEGKWLRSARGSGVMTITDGESTVELNVNDLSITQIVASQQ